MKTNVMTPQSERHRKLMVFLPVLVLPFLTLLFWSMKAKDDGGAEKAETIPGLNTHLPGAKLKDEHALDKMSFYEQADLASRKLKEEQQEDPYAKNTKDSAKTVTALAFSPPKTDALNGTAPDANEKKIYDRLNRLQQVMNKQAAQEPQDKPLPRSTPVRQPAEPKSQEDPELKQMSGIMDKLIQLQHPETVKPEAAAAKTVNKRFRAFRAVIDGKQKITENTVVKMKLLDSATINGQFFPKGQLVYAAGYFSNQRMKLDIKSVHIANMIYPVDLTVFDAGDGLEGISVPEAVTGDALRNGANSGVQNMELMSLDPSVSAQLATAGVNTAKGLFGKKIKPIKAKLEDQRAVLLRDNSSAKNK